MKKISSILLLTVFVFAFFCACAPKDVGGASSAVTESEVLLSSTVETSSVSTESEQQEDKSSSSKKEESSSSEKEPSSSEKEPSSSLKEESSSSKGTIIVQRPGSQSNSQGVKVSPADRNSVILNYFTTSYANSYGTTRNDGYNEMEDIIAAGYVNSVCETTLLRDMAFWKFVIKNDLTVWYDANTLFNSATKSLDDYLAYLYRTIDDYIKPFPERWERFNGVLYNEKIRRGESNDDFISETSAVYRKYGKRTFAILATGEFSDIDGNDGEAADMNKVKGDALKYITDVTFDSHYIDVRDGEHNSALAEKYKDTHPEIVDGKSYYRELTKMLVGAVGHQVNVWYLPCAYTCPIDGGLDGLERADEEYCLAQLNFFYEELANCDNTGGLMLYTYGMSSSNEKKGLKGLKYYLAVENDEEGGEKYKIRPESEKWEKYSQRLKEIVNSFNTQKADIVRRII